MKHFFVSMQNMEKIKYTLPSFGIIRIINFYIYTYNRYIYMYSYTNNNTMIRFVNLLDIHIVPIQFIFDFFLSFVNTKYQPEYICILLYGRSIDWKAFKKISFLYRYYTIHATKRHISIYHNANPLNKSIKPSKALKKVNRKKNRFLITYNIYTI